MLKLALSLAVTAALTFFTARSTAYASQLPFRRSCRCLPSQPCWPSVESWSNLNKTVNGRLIATHPPAYECHDPHYDSATCQKIQDGYHYDLWRQSQPGAALQINWEVDGEKGCLGFNRTLPCNQGAVPLYTVNATTVEHVQDTIKFATTFNIRLVIKNTGHDLLGRSTGASSLGLWVFYNKSITFNDNFIPEGASSDADGYKAIILGSGVQWKDVYEAADSHGALVVGGAGTVGSSGGFCQGGGHSFLSPRFGLCADNVLQYKVVVADGSVKIANAFQNKDLFWALRGGGGGTFGVVVEAIYRTHPAMNSIILAGYQIYYSGVEIRRKIISNWLSHQANLSEAGWSGLSVMNDNTMTIQYFLSNVDESFAKSSISPFLSYAESLEGVLVWGAISELPSFWSAFQMFNQNSYHAVQNTIIGSRLIPRRCFEDPDGTENLAHALIKAQDTIRGEGNAIAEFRMEIVGGGAVTNGSSVETSVHPAWRHTLTSIGCSVTWDDDTPFEKQQVLGRQMTSTMQVLRDITPDSGTYFNEADVNEPNWQSNFFGSNYPRLKSIKDQVDPTGLFACHKCVGSEDWSQDFICPRAQ